MAKMFHPTRKPVRWRKATERPKRGRQTPPKDTSDERIWYPFSELRVLRRPEKKSIHRTPQALSPSGYTSFSLGRPSGLSKLQSGIRMLNPDPERLGRGLFGFMSIGYGYGLCILQSRHLGILEYWRFRSS